MNIVAGKYARISKSKKCTWWLIVGVFTHLPKLKGKEHVLIKNQNQKRYVLLEDILETRAKWAIKW